MGLNLFVLLNCLKIFKDEHDCNNIQYFNLLNIITFERKYQFIAVRRLILFINFKFYVLFKNVSTVHYLSKLISFL